MGAGFVVVERYSALIQVQPNQVYTVTYSVKSELEEASADVYGRVVVAEYTVTATENDDLAANRISPGFDHGENVGGVTGWVKKSYAITTQPATRYVRLRAILGGPALEGGARGRLWLHGLEIKKP